MFLGVLATLGEWKWGLNGAKRIHASANTEVPDSVVADRHRLMSSVGRLKRQAIGMSRAAAVMGILERNQVAAGLQVDQ